jgi:hypothetical protein
METTELEYVADKLEEFVGTRLVLKPEGMTDQEWNEYKDINLALMSVQTDLGNIINQLAK